MIFPQDIFHSGLLKILLTIYLCILVQISFSQSDFKPAFIIKSSSDTVYGIGNMSKNQKYCLFKKAGSEEFTRYMPGEIKAFKIIEGKYYVPKHINENSNLKSWYFLEYLVDGEIDLYTIQKTDRFFLQKNDGELIELKDDIKKIRNIDGEEYMVQNKKYLGYIRATMKDAPELYPRIDQMAKLNQRNLVKISVDYHDAVCDDYDCINFTKKIPDNRYKIEIFSGFTRHNSFYSPHVGIMVHAWMPLTNERLYIKGGILYSDRPHWQKISPVHNSGYNIKFPVSLQYVFGKKSFKPTIAVGFPAGTFLTSSIQTGFIYSFSKDIELHINASLDGLIRYSKNYHDIYYDTPLAHSINVGLSYRLK